VKWLAAAALVWCVNALAFTHEIAVKQLPNEARQTLALIKAGGPFPYTRDGSVFSNRESQLPKRNRGYYREYTVKTPGARNRGARRVVRGKAGETWYTRDHYKTFVRIDR
jgi:ribonuclease T1